MASWSNLFASRSSRRVWVRKRPKDFRSLHVARPELAFNEIGQRSDQPDEFENDYSTLFLEVQRLARNCFTAQDGNLTNEKSPWVTDFAPDFYTSVEAIARGDPHTDDWEPLLRLEAERVFLVTSIIMRKLHQKVFCSLLFGASPAHARCLDTMDEGLLNVDGFARSELRANTNRVFLIPHDSEPPLFWESVDNLTAETATTLLQLYNVVGETWPEDVPELEIFYQDLYYIVAHAAFLNVRTRLVPGIFDFEWPEPGSQHEEQHQANLLPDVYEDSRERTEEYDRQHDQDPNNRLGRVKICASPMINYHTRRGETHVVNRTLKAHVVYYHGLIDRYEDASTYVPLDQYVQQVRAAMPRTTRPRLLTFSWWLCMFLLLGNMFAGILVLGSFVFPVEVDMLVFDWKTLLLNLMISHQVRLANDFRQIIRSWVAMMASFLR